MPVSPAPAPATRIEVAPGLVLDARRAAWMPEHGTLAVADPHLGYAWVQRARGQLLPVARPEDTVDRLLRLSAEFAARELVLLGDVVHAALDLQPVRGALEALTDGLRGRTVLRLVAGNHDRRLAGRLADWGLPLGLTPEHRTGGFRMVHGDGPIPAEDGENGWLLSGHEHPAVRIGDGIAHSARVPAFLVAPRWVILPAFSDWAAGCVLGQTPFLSATARGARFEQAVACFGPRLLPLPVTYQLGRPTAGGILPAPRPAPVTSPEATSPSSSRRPRRSRG